MMSHNQTKSTIKYLQQEGKNNNKRLRIKSHEGNFVKISL